MIFWRAKEILEGGSELFRAEAELMSRRVKRLLISSFFVLMIALAALAGLILLTAGVVIMLSEQLGWGMSLISVGVFYLLCCAIIYGVSMLQNEQGSDSREQASSNESTQEVTSDDEEQPKAEAANAKDRLKNAASPDPDDAPNRDQPSVLDTLDELKDTAIDVGMKNPVALGSAALLVVSLLGPGKTIKMISRGAAAAGLASTMIESLGGSNQDSKAS